MATILIAPAPGIGHVNSSLRIAREFRARGHRVCYVCLAEFGERIREEGFEFEPLFESIYPKGQQAEFDARVARASPLGKLRLLREASHRENQKLQAMLDGEPDRIFARLQPELFICDFKEMLLPLVAYGHGVPTVVFFTTIPFWWTSSSQLARPSESGGFRAKLRGFLRARFHAVVSRLGLEPRLDWGVTQLARKHGYPLKVVNSIPQVMRSDVVELVLSPREFSAHGDRGLKRYHLGPCIALDRREPGFPWERLQEGKPLIYVAMGTVAFKSGLDTGILRAAAEVAARRPEWQFVLSVGNILEPASLGSSPNLVTVSHAPQLQLLRRAAAMVTHCGISSAKECIYFGVPMVAVPLANDQYAVAQRVVRNGLGVRLPAHEVTPEALDASLAQVLSKPEFKSAVDTMSALFRAADQSARLDEVIQSLLQEARPYQASPSRTAARLSLAAAQR